VKILLVHPDLRKTGGAEWVALHIAGWLLTHTDARITILTLYQVDVIRQLTRIGYPADSLRLTVECASLPFFVPAEGPQAMARLAWLHRAARKGAASFDIGISTYNEIWLDLPTIQYIHHPFFVDTDQMEKHRLAAEGVIASKRRWPHRLYDALNKFVAGADPERYRGNISLTNSRFMAGVIRDCYGIDAAVVYPSFIHPSDNQVESPQRVGRILITGRFAPDKEILPFLDEALRHSPVPIDVAGLTVDIAYTQAIQDVADKSNGLITVHRDLPDDDLRKLMRRNRYYVNTRRFEHFGIATLEAASEGCLPFVHASGGSIEIIPFPELQYDDAKHVFDRIRLLESDAVEYSRLMGDIRRHIETFDLEHFHDGIATAFSHLTKRVARS
jgi:hypothetical protein